MLDIPKLTSDQLKKEETYLDILTSVCLCFEKPKPAQALALLLERRIKGSEFERSYPVEARAYRDLIVLLRLSVLKALKEKEILEIVENNVLEALIYPDFLDQLRIKLFELPIIFRDGFLNQIKQALRRNRQQLGTHPIQIIQTRTPQKPLVCVWLLDYDNVLGEKFHRDYERKLYLDISPNVKTLNKKEKALLDKLLTFYDILRLDVREPGGLGSYPLSSVLPLSELLK